MTIEELQAKLDAIQAEHEALKIEYEALKAKPPEGGEAIAEELKALKAESAKDKEQLSKFAEEAGKSENNSKELESLLAEEKKRVAQMEEDRKFDAKKRMEKAYESAPEGVKKLLDRYKDDPIKQLQKIEELKEDGLYEVKAQEPPGVSRYRASQGGSENKTVTSFAQMKANETKGAYRSR